MNKRQIQQKAEQLCVALQVLFENQCKDKARAKVSLTAARGPRSFWYQVKMPSPCYWDAFKIAREIEHIIPNTRVTEQNVFFYSNSMEFIVKELGKKGTYEIDIEQVVT